MTMAKKKKKKSKANKTEFFLSPQFVRFLKSKANADGHIEPERQDFDFSNNSQTEAGQAAQYRIAQARRIIRLHDEWQAMQN
jgi:hypothetical protein